MDIKTNWPFFFAYCLLVGYVWTVLTPLERLITVAVVIFFIGIPFGSFWLASTMQVQP